jgi:hypothetical protein
MSDANNHTHVTKQEHDEDQKQEKTNGQAHNNTNQGGGSHFVFKSKDGNMHDCVKDGTCAMAPVPPVGRSHQRVNCCEVRSPGLSLAQLRPPTFSVIVVNHCFSMTAIWMVTLVLGLCAVVNAKHYDVRILSKAPSPALSIGNPRGQGYRCVRVFRSCSCSCSCSCVYARNVHTRVAFARIENAALKSSWPFAATCSVRHTARAPSRSIRPTYPPVLT